MVENGLVLTNEQETTGPAFPWCLKGIASDSKSQVLFHSRQKESRQYSFSEKKKKRICSSCLVCGTTGIIYSYNVRDVLITLYINKRKEKQLQSLKVMNYPIMSDYILKP